MSSVGFDSTAMAWAAAVNEYEERSMNSAMKSYRKGVINGNKGKNPGKLAEVDPQDLTGDPLIIPVDGDGNISPDGDLSFVGDPSGGMVFDCGENTVNGVTDNYTVIFTVDYSYEYHIPSQSYIDKRGLVVLEVLNSKNEVVARTYRQANIGAVNNYWDYHGTPYLYRWVMRWTINPRLSDSAILARFAQKEYTSSTVHYYDDYFDSGPNQTSGGTYWTPTLEYLNAAVVKSVWKNAKTVTNLIK